MGLSKRVSWVQAAHWSMGDGKLQDEGLLRVLESFLQSCAVSLRCGGGERAEVTMVVTQ